MGEMRQSPAERAHLKEVWEKEPAVQDFSEAAEAFAWKHDLKFSVEGLNRMFEFSKDWFTTHGPLPDSGILVG